MLLAIHVLPFILLLFCITTAFPQPPYPSLIRSLQPRNHPLILRNGWGIISFSYGFRFFYPVQPAFGGLDALYTEAIAAAQDPHSELEIAVTFLVGYLQLIFRANEGPLTWITIGHFCEKMLEQARRGSTQEYEMVLTNDYFAASPMWVKLRIVGEAEWRRKGCARWCLRSQCPS